VKRIVLVLLLLARPAFAQDAIDLSQAVIAGSPADVASWPATTRISQIDFDPQAGLSFTFDAKDRWPNYTPPGWDGPIQYTVWACAHVDVWHCSGFIQMWQTRAATGAPLPSQYRYWWGAEGSVTSGVFGAYRAREGEQMAFLVTAGDARANGSVTSVRERSNVVLVALPQGDSGTFTFAEPKPAPIPTFPIPIPKVPIEPPAVIPVDPTPPAPVVVTSPTVPAPAPVQPVPPPPSGHLTWWQWVLVVLASAVGVAVTR
jgi:hypothetical protein